MMQAHIGILRELADALERGERVALATIVDTHGSTPQKTGARLLVRAGGAASGTLGGGCIEAEAHERALASIESGLPAVLDFTLNEDIAVDYGLSCGGTELVLVDPAWSAADAPMLRRLCAAADAGQRAALITLVDELPGARPAAKLAVFADETAAGDMGGLREKALRLGARVLAAPRPQPALVTLLDDARAFVDVFAEPPEVVVVGGGHVGRAVAAAARLAGYRIAVIDDRPEFANRARFPEADTVIAGDISEAIAAYPATPNSAIVIVTRGHKYDYQALAAALRTRAGYVGLMGSRRKAALIFRQLLADGVPEERLRDVAAPIGLDIGAVSPEEIAISVMAEITMRRSGGSGRPLSERSDVVAAAGRRVVRSGGG